MAQTPEGKIKSKVDDWLKENMPGCFKFKIPGGPFGQVGLADYIIVYLGVPIMIEVKADETKRASTKQLAQLKAFKDAGGVSCLLKGFEEYKLIFIKGICVDRNQRQIGPLDACS